MAKILNSNIYDHLREPRAEHWAHDVHPVRERGVYVNTDEGDVDVSAKQIRDNTGLQRVSLCLLQAVLDYFCPGKSIDKEEPMKGFKRKK